MAQQITRWADLQQAGGRVEGHAKIGPSSLNRPGPSAGQLLHGVATLAEALGRSPATIRRWERLGALPPPPYRSASYDPRGERRQFTSAIITDIAGVLRRHHVGKRLERRLWPVIRSEVEAIYEYRLQDHPWPESVSRSTPSPLNRSTGPTPASTAASVTRLSWAVVSRSVGGRR